MQLDWKIISKGIKKGLLHNNFLSEIKSEFNRANNTRATFRGIFSRSRLVVSLNGICARNRNRTMNGQFNFWERFTLRSISDFIRKVKRV